MTRNEIEKLIKEIQCVYVFFKNTGEEMISSWERILQDTSYEDAIKHLDEYALDPSNTYPPTPGRLASQPQKKIYLPNLNDVVQEEVVFHINIFGEIEDDEGRIYADPEDPYRTYVEVTDM